jgi:hypothetical protein
MLPIVKVAWETMYIVVGTAILTLTVSELIVKVFDTADKVNAKIANPSELSPEPPPCAGNAVLTVLAPIRMSLKVASVVRKLTWQVTSQSPGVSVIDVTLTPAPLVNGIAAPGATVDVIYSPTIPGAALSFVDVPFTTSSPIPFLTLLVVVMRLFPLF